MKRISVASLLILSTCGTYVKYSHNGDTAPFTPVKNPQDQFFCNNSVRYQSPNSVVFGWDSPALNATGNVILIGSESKSYTERHELGMAHNYSTDLLAARNYTFSIRYYNSSGIETKYTTEIECFDVKMEEFDCTPAGSDTRYDITYLKPTVSRVKPQFRYNPSYDGSIFANPDAWVDPTQQVLSSENLGDGTTRETIRITIPGGAPPQTYFLRENACWNVGV